MLSRQLFTPRLAANLRTCHRKPTAFTNSRAFHSRPQTFEALLKQNAYARTLPVKNRLPFMYKAAGLAGVGIGISAFSAPAVHCEGPPTAAQPAPPVHPDGLPPPQSSVNLYELSFGTVCGVCAGVFIKKGIKTLAFVIGGVFVLLQYLGSSSVVKVDWAVVGKRFENLFYTRDALGNKRAPNVGSLWNWMVNFLTANFQQRASFIAGLALGLRVG